MPRISSPRIVTFWTCPCATWSRNWEKVISSIGRRAGLEDVPGEDDQDQDDHPEQQVLDRGVQPVYSFRGPSRTFQHNGLDGNLLLRVPVSSMSGRLRVAGPRTPCRSRRRGLRPPRRRARSPRRTLVLRSRGLSTMAARRSDCDPVAAQLVHQVGLDHARVDDVLQEQARACRGR